MRGTTQPVNGAAAPPRDKSQEQVPLPLDSRLVSPAGNQDSDSDAERQTTQNALGRLPKGKREESNGLAKDTEAAPRIKKDVSSTPVPVNPTPHSCTKTSLGIHNRRQSFGTGVLRPALIVGLGRSGLETLKQLRMELREHFGHPDNLPNVRLLYIDTDPEGIQAATRGKGDALSPGEVLLARLGRPSQYLKAREGKLPYESWLDPKILYRIPRQRNHAGARALGRLALVDNQRAVLQRLETALAVCIAPETLEKAAQETGLDKLTNVPRVYIVGNLAGNTGGGMFIDLAYMIRQLLRAEGQEQAELEGIFLLPGVKKEARAGGLANAVAALTELNHFSAADAQFNARYDSRDQIAKLFQEKGPPFRNVYLLPGGDSRSSADLVQAGHFLFYNLVTPLGHMAEHFRRQASGARNTEELGYHTFGCHRIIWPRQQLREQLAGTLCTRLVQHWMSKDSKNVQNEIGQWAQEQWEAQELRPENLIARHQELCEKILEQAPEKLFSAILGPLAQELATTPGAKAPDVNLKIAPVIQAVDALEKLLGVPEINRPESMMPAAANTEPGTIEKALASATETIAADCDQKLAELVVRLFEEPLYRLAGAEEAVRRLSACVQQALESQDALVRELHERTAQVHLRLHALMENPTQKSPTETTPRWRSPFTRRPQSLAPKGSDFIELLGSFAKCRYQSLVLSTVHSVYVRLRGTLSDQMREVGFCRHRLTELADLIKERSSSQGVFTSSSEDNILVPKGCANLAEYVRRLESNMSQDDVLAFDEQVQKLVRKQFRALVQVCMASSHVIRTLGPALLEEAERFLDPRLEGANVAELLLARYPDNAEGQSQLGQDLLSAYERAGPELAAPAAEQEACIITVPPGEAGARFRTLVQSVFPKALLVSSDSADEILIFRGCQHLDLGSLEQLGPTGQAAYRSGTMQDSAWLHSRRDITEWHALAPV